MKKIITFLISICCVFTGVCAFSACGSTSDDGVNTIVCTIFPQYDWVREILGDEQENFELVLLTENGVDLHSFQPTVSDKSKIKYAELFIYAGGESDSWVEDAITSTKTNALTVSMLDEVISAGDALEEELKEGMEDGEEEGEEGGEEEETEYDEHVWLSLKNAQTLVNIIAEKICLIDEENSAEYLANAASYCEKLSALDAEYTAATSSAANDTLIFADRFPFKYMVDDYGLDYYAALKGCSSQETITVSTIKFLADKLDELNLKYIMTIETSDGTWANGIKSYTKNGDQEILVMHSCQSVTASDISGGATYLSIMQSNLQTLITALN